MPMEHPLPVPTRHDALQPSMAIELTWLTVACGPVETQFLCRYPKLQERSATFFGDGSPLLLEIMVCAQQLGCLYGWNLAPLMNLERHTLRVPEHLALETEWPEERDLTLERLHRLAKDAGLRKRFSALLRAVWAEAEPSWDDVGRGTVERALTRCQASLDHGTQPFDLIPAEHLAHREQFAEINRKAVQDGTLIVTPCYFAQNRGSIVALPGLLSITVGTGVSQDIARRRTEAERVAAALKVLSDPTRVLILTELDRTPATVGETASRVGIAQPTASVHMRQLREAGLIETVRRDGRTVYEVKREAVDRMLTDARASVLERLN